MYCHQHTRQMHLSHNRDTTKQHATKKWPLSKKCLFSLILILSVSYETNCTLVKDITKGISFVKNKIIDLLKVLRPRVLWDRVPSSLQSKPNQTFSRAQILNICKSEQEQHSDFINKWKPSPGTTSGEDYFKILHFKRTDLQKYTRSL